MLTHLEGVETIIIYRVNQEIDLGKGIVQTTNNRNVGNENYSGMHNV